MPKSSEDKSVVIKVQVPIDLLAMKATKRGGDMRVYTKKRDLVCSIRRAENPAAYDRIFDVIAAKGVGGLKAYFAAELKSKDELIIKVSEVLAEQPF